MSEINTKITGLHPKVAEAARKTIEEAKARKMVVGVHSGLRTAEEQESLYALGRTRVNPDGKSTSNPMGNVVTNAKAWESWHSYGLSVDLVFKNEMGGWTWNRPESDWKALGGVGKMFGFEWGGDWQTFKDRPHFQMRGRLLGLADAKTILFEK